MPHERLYSPGPTDIRENQRLWIEPVDRREFAIGQKKKILLILQSQVARNIYNLLRRKIIDDAFCNYNLNCHQAAAIALGERTRITWGSTKFRGECMSVEEALQCSLPCGMQIHSSSAFGQILHSAVLLGTSVDDSALAFHKNGIAPMELCHIHTVIAAYRQYYDGAFLPFTFYTPKPRVT